MIIEHIAIWTSNLERLRAFYETYFGAQSGAKYTNPNKGFSSYFLTFTSGARLEIMQREDVIARGHIPGQEALGYAHLALEVGDEKAVDQIAHALAENGFVPIDGPRQTGDGYYECVILDPDGNRLELSATIKRVKQQ